MVFEELIEFINQEDENQLATMNNRNLLTNTKIPSGKLDDGIAIKKSCQ
ncbi:MAG: hypothetical protein IPN72_13660 [Saprospiraceae bacterium]|nr:hypothetical protein [Saprospiraceae bacterium]